MTLPQQVQLIAEIDDLEAALSDLAKGLEIEDLFTELRLKAWRENTDRQDLLAAFKAYRRQLAELTKITRWRAAAMSPSEDAELEAREQALVQQLSEQLGTMPDETQVDVEPSETVPKRNARHRGRIEALLQEGLSISKACKRVATEDAEAGRWDLNPETVRSHYHRWVRETHIERQHRSAVVEQQAWLEKIDPDYTQLN